MLKYTSKNLNVCKIYYLDSYDVVIFEDLFREMEIWVDVIDIFHNFSMDGLCIIFYSF